MAKTYNFDIDQNATKEFTVIYLQEGGAPVDLRNFQAKMDIKQSYDSVKSILTLYPVGDVNATGLYITPTEGKIKIRINDTDTAKFSSKSLVYDIIISGNVNVTRLMQGLITVNRGVTVK